MNSKDGSKGPASLAAERAGDTPSSAETGERRYPQAFDPHDATGNSTALAATRALLKVNDRVEAAQVLRHAITDMGGHVVAARLAGPDAIPVDVSLGVGEPQVVVADPVDPAALRLARHLPMLVEDALASAARSEHHHRQSLRATQDALTGVASRGEIGPRLGMTAFGDAICMLDLDGFKKLNDTRGHGAGDRVLQHLGELLRVETRDGDFVGRYGGDEFIVVLSATPLQVACQRMERLASTWTSNIGQQASVSIGVAAVESRGAVIAAQAADAALYRAKRLGRSRVEMATPGDYLTGHWAGP